MIAEIETPIWSKSRFQSLEECERKFHYSTHSEDNKVKALKKIKNRHLWTTLHLKEILATVLKTLRQGSEPPILDDLLAQTKVKMREEFKQSKSASSEPTALFEHYYKKDIPFNVWQQHWVDLEKAIRWFYGSSWLTRLKLLGPENWKVIDELLEFDVGGIKSYVKMDCALEVEGRFILIQWKGTPMRASDEKNMEVAGLYAHDVWDAMPENIDCMIVSLAAEKSKKIEMNEEVLMETQLRIQEQTALIQNSQLKIENNPAQAVMTTHLGHCLRCNFQILCHPQGIS